ncbi:MAG: imidazole glycerol phosphate synthase subunit HisH [Candidatus Bathyarchaeota archaeon]|nr:imidazole glycerol phosphate synthase subunit HisH [Candidatus Bathyarchaeota archaeon]MDW8022978.1 imidazole glycerol phosphate synthase subunit HisH [Nitrososphaerota archaeon]MDW8041072.1 imidazole glycerol phosphate synthase subunit HisH [Nitrososphaerota archaeon]
MPKAVIMDYGVGNLYSLKCALSKVGFTPLIGLSRILLKQADAVILPGVGNFSAASRRLTALREYLVNLAKGGVPFFGICLGMQLMFQKSEEGPGEGLALLEGENTRLPRSVKVPHMGWNTVVVLKPTALFENLESPFYCYFVHSYYPVPSDGGVIYAETIYGVKFASVVVKQNVFGTQFHPEKSGSAGLKLLENFLNFVKR